VYRGGSSGHFNVGERFVLGSNPGMMRRDPACALRKRRKKDIGPEKAEEQKHLNKENFTSEEAAEKGCAASVHQAWNFMLKKDIGPEKAEEEKTLMRKQKSRSI
jgi:ribosomal protein L14E/L6E/L27E